MSGRTSIDSDQMFPSRHRLLVVALWAQVPLIAVLGLAVGEPFEVVGPIALLLIVLAAGSALARGALISACLVSLGLAVDAIIFVSLAGPNDWSHFYFLAVVAAVSLYRQRLPLGLAVVMLTAYHLVVGLAPSGQGIEWVGVHVSFVVLMALITSVAWSSVATVTEDTTEVERLSLAFEAAPIGIAMLKPSGEFIQVNAALARMIGHDPATLPGSNVRSIVHGDDHAQLGEAWERMGNDDSHSATTWARCVTSAGATIWARVSLSMVPWSPGRPSMVVLQLEDVTGTYSEQRRLERLVADKDEFVATVASEIRRSMAPLLDLAVDDDPTLREIGGTARQTASIVDDLAISARAEAQLTTVVPLPVDAPTLCHDVVTSIPGASSVRLDLQPTTIWGDPHLIRQVLFGLVSNAVRYGGPDVTVRSVTSGPDTVISVADNGPAVPETERERMFAADLRFGLPVTRPAAVGLGLSVGRHLARAMGGDLTYGRGPDAENVYELRLPSERLDASYDEEVDVDVPV